MSKLYVGLILVISILNFRCSSHHEHDEPVQATVAQYPKDISIPIEFMKKIEADLLAESKVLNPVYIFIPIKVQFTEKTHDTLVSPKIEYSFPKGGGQVDLRSLIKGQGSFYMSFPPEQFHEMAELEHLFFVSQSPVTVIDNEKYGIGCGKWVDLKSSFLNLQKNNFLKVNSTGFRQIAVLAGNYIFVFRKLNQISISQITITDSENKDRMCPQITEGSL